MLNGRFSSVLPRPLAARWLKRRQTLLRANVLYLSKKMPRYTWCRFSSCQLLTLRRRLTSARVGRDIASAHARSSLKYYFLGRHLAAALYGRHSPCSRRCCISRIGSLLRFTQIFLRLLSLRAYDGWRRCAIHQTSGFSFCVCCYAEYWMRLKTETRCKHFSCATLFFTISPERKARKNARTPRDEIVAAPFSSRECSSAFRFSRLL